MVHPFLVGGGGAAHASQHVELPSTRDQTVPPAVEVRSLNCWTNREVHGASFFFKGEVLVIFYKLELKCMRF